MGLFDDFSGNFASLLNLNQPNTTVNNSYAGLMQPLLQQYQQQQQQQKAPQALVQPIQSPVASQSTTPMQPVQSPVASQSTTPMQPIQSPVASQSDAASPATGTYSPPSGSPQGLTGSMNSLQDMNPQSLQAMLTVLANPAYRKLTGQ